MEPLKEFPEESFPRNLTYLKFRYAYIRQRKDAKQQEIDLAWKLYRDKLSMGIQQTSPLCSMPHELLRLLPTYHRSILSILKRTCKRLNYLLKTNMDRVYSSSISKFEFEKYLDSKSKEFKSKEFNQFIPIRIIILEAGIFSCHSWKATRVFDEKSSSIIVDHFQIKIHRTLDGSKAITRKNIVSTKLKRSVTFIGVIMESLDEYLKNETIPNNVLISEQDLTNIIARRNHPNSNFASQYARNIGFSLLYYNLFGIDTQIEQKLGNMLTDLSEFIHLAMFVIWTRLYQPDSNIIPSPPPYQIRASLIWDLNTITLEDSNNIRNIINRWISRDQPNNKETSSIAMIEILSVCIRNNKTQ